MAGEEVIGATMAGGIGIFILIYLLIGFAIFIGAILLMIFWIMMLVDLIKRDFKKENDKIIWVLIVILASWIGAIVYYFIIKKPDKH